MNIVTVSKIIELVSEYFSVDKEDILHGGRTRHIARPRQIAMYLAYKYTGNSMPALGRKFGKHHTTILYACELIGKDEQYKTILYELDKILLEQLNKEFKSNNKPSRTEEMSMSTAFCAGL